MTDARQLLEEWQTRLGLNDWEIELETDCDYTDLAIENSDACATFEESIKVAKIQIVAPEKRVENAIGKFDFEKTLIHELLHLKMCLLEQSDDEKDLHERVLHIILNDIARALADAKRS